MSLLKKLFPRAPERALPAREPGSRLSNENCVARAPYTQSELASAISTNEFLSDRWDREWLAYFNKENPRPFCTSHEQLELIDSVDRKNESQIFATRLTRIKGKDDMPALNVWARGSDLEHRRVLEVGCGPGLLGKQLGKIAAAYVGIDYSRLALRIAELTCPDNCFLLHISDLGGILEFRDSIDTMIGRHFFIHQNFDNAQWLLVLAHALLKPGGEICADFYQRNPALKQGIVHPAKSALDPRYPSCGFEFSDDELIELVTGTGFSVESAVDQPSIQRRFVRFVKL